MHNLIVVGFHDRYRAAEALNALRRMNDDWLLDLDDAVAVYRDRRGNVRYQQSVSPRAGVGAAWGALWGSLLGLLLAGPFSAGAGTAVGAAALIGGAVAGGVAGGVLDAAWWKEHLGIPDDFVRGVGNLIGPGDSAIFAWVQAGDPEMVARRFRGLGGTVLRATLTPEQSAKLEAVLHSRA
ncbi:MAG: DUF1269 domain-containing protein [Thermoguttaceae bacterium]